MEQVQTIVCPNCGAVTASNQNCEYCGSMLTKVATALCNEGDDIKTTLSDLGFGKSAYVSYKLVHAIENNIKQSQKHNAKTTCIIKCKYYGCVITLNTPECGYPTVLQIEFGMDNSSTYDEFTSFENSHLVKLFSIRQEHNYLDMGSDYMICSLQLDDDTRTSAQIVQYILKEVFNINDSEIVLSTYVTLNGEEFKIVSAREKQAVDAEIEQDEKEYLEAEQRYLNELKKIEKDMERAIMDERATYVRSIKRESILPSFAQIFGIAAILAMGVYWREMYSLTTALIILGAVIALSMIVKGVSKSRRINEVNDLETFKTKYSKIKASTQKELPQKPKRPQKTYPKYLEE